MTETHFTPGPWEFCLEAGYEYGFTALWNPETRDEIITTGGFNDGDDPITWMGEELQPADRSLIEAAPDLYAALEALLNDVCEMKDVDLDVIYEGRNGSLSKAKTALKKARGES